MRGGSVSKHRHQWPDPTPAPDTDVPLSAACIGVNGWRRGPNGNELNAAHDEPTTWSHA